MSTDNMHRPDDNRHFRQLLLEAVEKATVEMDRRAARAEAARTIQRACRRTREHRRRRWAATTLQRAWRETQTQPTCGGWWLW